MAKAANGEGQKEFRKDRCQYRHSRSLFLLTVTVAVVMLMVKVMIYLLTTQPRNFIHTNGTK